jgi:hypothetical protein
MPAVFFSKAQEICASLLIKERTSLTKKKKNKKPHGHTHNALQPPETTQYVELMKTTANQSSNSHHYKLNRKKVKAKYLFKPTHTKKITQKIFRIPVSAILTRWKLQFGADVLQFVGTQVTVVENELAV